MPHGQFNNVTLKNADTIHIEGESLKHDELEETPTAIQIAVVAVADFEKRVDDITPNTLKGGWDAFAPTQTATGERFGEGEVVVVLGASTHSHDGPNPFIWCGFFKIGAAGSKDTMVTLVTECA